MRGEEEARMRYRIGLWASAGFIVAVAWAFYAFVTEPPAMTSADPILTLVKISCPIVFASVYFHFGVSSYWSLVANTATYALIGLTVETLRQRANQAKQFKAAHYPESGFAQST